MTSPDLVDSLIAGQAVDGLGRGAMFGSVAITLDSKVVAVLSHGELVFKLGAGSPAHERALALVGAHPFDPGSRGRPYKDWVAVPADSPDGDAKFDLLLAAAIAFLRSGRER
jgi:TfoX/Sxy family transcriptional regulator of competence genes